MDHSQYIDFDYLHRSNQSIGQGYLTNSKNPSCLIKGVYPTHAIKAKGPYIYTKNGGIFTDFICGLGSCILGYSNKEVNDVAMSEMQKGMCYSISSRTEVEAAETMKAVFNYERWKFLKTGTEACMAALKIARTYTGREYVLTAGYHGWSPEFINAKLTPPGLGTTYQNYIFKLEDLNQINDTIAAVIVEPIELDNSIERVKWLNDLRQKCTENGVVLIFDEVITGGRYKSLTVARNYSLVPDLIIMGKAIGNGFPIAAIGGKKELLDMPYFVSGTYYGENVSLAVMKKVVRMLASDQEFDNSTLWNHAQNFVDEFNAICPDKISIVGYGTRGSFFSTDENFKWVFWQECAKAGILFGPSFFFNFAHIEIEKKVMADIKDILFKMKIKLPKLEGEKPCQPISSMSRRP